MARCFLTGVDLPIENSYLLDVGPAYRILQDLKQRITVIERLIKQFTPLDDVEIYDSKNREMITTKYRRVVSPTVAETLRAIYPQVQLFIKWSEWKLRYASSDHKEKIGVTADGDY